MEVSAPFSETRRNYSVSISAISFGVLVTLNFLYLNRLLIALTYEKFRLGAFVLVLSVATIIVSGKIVKSFFLAFAIFLFSLFSTISALINNIPWGQFLAFIRIPIIIYLIYDLVWRYMHKEENTKKVFRFMLFIGGFQLPILVFQRVAFPWLPKSIVYTTTLVDFGMGTFTSDTAMGFALVGLVILLLFDPAVKKLSKGRWLLSIWFTLTIFISNSQIQQATIVLVWISYIIFSLRLKDLGIIFLALVTLTVLSLLIVQSSVLITYTPSLNTLSKISKISEIFDTGINYTVFLNGGTARTEAINYYIHHPLKWLGNGPGSAYNTATGERTIGGWGHVYTFYAEVGILGLLLSYFVFFAIAFPLRFKRNTVTAKFSWVHLLMFFAMIMVTIVKYPMGDTGIAFTYCVILVGHQALHQGKKKANQDVFISTKL